MSWKSMDTRKKCKWCCLIGMLVSLLIVLICIIISFTEKVDTIVVSALIAWGLSITTTFGLVVAGIHKLEGKEKLQK